MRWRRIVAVVLLVVCVGVNLVITFTHIDSTRTRLFVDYWWVWLLTCAGLYLAAWLNAVDERQHSE